MTNTRLVAIPCLGVATLADVFLSYKREDRVRAIQVADALRAEGFSVFFDPEILVGDSWDQVIERELEAAVVVVVLWSKQSRHSEWVRNEAREGKRRNCLCPAIIEECTVPIEFNAIQAANLCEWTPTQPRNGEWERLLKSIHPRVVSLRSKLGPDDPPNNSTDSGPPVDHTILGKGLGSPEFVALKRYFDLKKGTISGDSHYLHSKRDGIELQIKDDVVHAVHLFAERADDYWQYKGKLPFGLSFDDTRADVEQRLGRPAKAVGNGTVQFYTRHDRGDVCVWITYHFTSPSDMRNRIHHVSF